MPVFTLDSNKLPAEQLAVRTITTEIAVVENIKQFNTFAEFYPYYLSEHANSTCRRLHFIGTTLVIFILAMTIAKGAWLLLLALPLAGYSFAWVGHFFFEKNRPATFQHPLYSLLGDFVMYRDMILGRVAF
mgnify:FL=1|jgi:hypothetical protein|nr:MULTISPECIES: DUF962 domain-containing protein [unclassified Pseudomonas]